MGAWGVVILKLMWKAKSLRIAKTILLKNNKMGGINLHDFKIWQGIDTHINGTEQTT